MIIYYLKNNINRKGYIGIDSNSDKNTTQLRLNDHLKYARSINNNKNWNVKYQLIDKKIAEYGFENFSYTVLYETNDFEDLKKKEIYYISKYNTFVNNGFGYNLTLGGDGFKGFNTTKIVAYSIDGDFLKVYNSLLDAAKDLNIKYNSIQQSLSKSNKTVIAEKKYIFKYYDKKYPQKIKNTVDKRVNVFNIKGLLIDVCYSKKDFSKKYNVPYHKITSFFKGRSHSINNKYILQEYNKNITSIDIMKTSNKRSVVLLNINNREYTTFDSISSLAMYINTSIANITNLMKRSNHITKKKFHIIDEKEFDKSKIDHYIKKLNKNG